MKFKFLIILIIVTIGAFFRFYKLDWGQGLFAHPDEYHIVSSVDRLSFPYQMHPHFFSYGTVIIYLIYFTQEIFKHFSILFNTFLIGRFYSAFFSTLTIFVVYNICLTIFTKKNFALIAAFLTAITPGLIQQAHFATPESTQTFLMFSSLLFIIKFVKQNKILHLFFASIFWGLSLGVKVSSGVLLLPLIIAVATRSHVKLNFKKPILFIKQISNELSKFIIIILIIVFTSIIVFAIVSPYVFLDFPAFRSNFEYEGGLAIGEFLVFYTRQFINTIPIAFQADKILPFVLGPILFLFSLAGFIFMLINSIKKPKMEFFIILITFLSIFLPNAFLFAKWTRFISPTFPFFAIFASFLLNLAYLNSKFISKVLTYVLLITTFLWTAAFFSIYLHSDIRIAASAWIEKKIPENSNILVEGGNTIDIPLKGNFRKISLDFYNLEDNLSDRYNIASELEKSDYFLIQSRRVFMNHQRLPGFFPVTANFYNALFNGKLGFKQIKEFHSYPTLQIGNFKLEFPDERAEETWSVFDHPVIRIFKKTQQLSLENYEKLLEIQ
jgi:hypothetical protein